MKSMMRAWMIMVTSLAPLAFPALMSPQGEPLSSRGLPRYTVTDLGNFGGTFSAAEGINDRSLVDGVFGTTAGQQHAFFWRDGIFTDLGTLGGPNSGLGSLGHRPNERGEIVGASDTSNSDPASESFCNFLQGSPPTSQVCLAFVWQRGVMTPLPTLGGTNGGADSVNNRGEAVGGAENGVPDPTCTNPSAPRPKPALWEKGVALELPTLPGDLYGVVNAINDEGQAVGVTVGNCAGSPAHAALWQNNGAVITLGSLGGKVFDEGQDINNRGQVAGFASLSGDSTFHAFYWTESSGMRDLGALPGDSASFATGINSKGQVVGTSCADPTCASSAGFLWENGVITDVNSLIPAGSPLFLLSASGINSRGEIVGFGVQVATGQVDAYLATPNDAEVLGTSPSATALEQTVRRPNAVLPAEVRKLLPRLLGRKVHFLAPLTAHP